MSTGDTTGANRFKSTLAGYTVEGDAHSLSAWFVLSLRLMMGIAFAWTGLEKVLEPGWGAGGYLANVAATNGNPLEGMFAAMAESQLMLDFLAIAVPWGELLIGLGLIFGVMTRFAAFWGAFMMLMFYFGNWSIEHGVINGDFAYMLVYWPSRRSVRAASWAWTPTSSSTRSAASR